MKDIYYKGFRLYVIKSKEDKIYKAEVVGRYQARFKGLGKTFNEAIENLKIDIDKVR